MMNANLAPEILTSWRLFLTAHATIVSQIDQRLHDAGQIPLNWYDVLIELYEAPDQRLRMSEVADRVLLTRSGLTRLVDKLEQEGYLKRELDPKDRRSFYAVITSQGVEAMRGAWPVYSESISSLFAAHLTAEDATVLVRIFSTMAARK
jgi:DNA-binding MarR family transcriptional regulator